MHHREDVGDAVAGEEVEVVLGVGGMSDRRDDRQPLTSDAGERDLSGLKVSGRRIDRGQPGLGRVGGVVEVTPGFGRLLSRSVDRSGAMSATWRGGVVEATTGLTVGTV